MPKQRTRETKQIEKLLLEHFPDHPPEYPPTAYRYNPASLRVRVVSDRFKGKLRSEREEMVLPLIHQLPEDTQADIMILLLLAPDELESSLMNVEFEDPSPSML
jgi:stress-induced morphogen